jgi:hypothetical protein
MKFLPKEYRGIAAASAFAVLSLGGSGAYFGYALEQKSAAMETAGKKSEEHKRLLSANPPPSPEQLKQLESHRDTCRATLGELRKTFAAIDFNGQEQTPQEFQKTLNDKTQAFIKKAEKYSVTLPAGFYMDFDQYIKKLPPPEMVPIATRRLSAADTLLDSLLESRPISLRAFKIRTPEQASELETASKPPPPPPSKPDPKAPKVAAPPPPKPILEAQTYTLQFTARPDSLRDFLNTVAAETRGLFVTRRLKIVNNKEKEPPIKGALGAATEPAQGSGSLGSGGSFARYVLGDENVEVEMSVDLISLVGDTAQAIEKEHAKQP